MKKWFTHSHTAMQGASLGFSVLPNNTSTYRAGLKIFNIEKNVHMVTLMEMIVEG